KAKRGSSTEPNTAARVEMPAASPTKPAASVEPPGAEASGTATPAENANPEEYRIGEGDVLSINVWGEPTASVPNVVVRPDGKISLPLIKEVAVAGMTPKQLERTITEQLSKLIREADVTVVVAQINSKRIYFV